jgi:trk system potassium uptake protein TrkA
VRSWLLPEEMTPHWRDATGSLLLMDRVLPEHLAGQKLSTLEISGKVCLAAVTRAGVPRLDATHLVGQDGDLLHFIVLKDGLPALAALLAPSEPAELAVAAKVQQ